MPPSKILAAKNHGKPIIFHQSVSESHRRAVSKKKRIQNILYKPLNLKAEIVFGIDLYIKVFHGKHRFI